MLALRHSFYFTLFSILNFIVVIFALYTQAWDRLPFIWMWMLAFWLYSFFKITTMLQCDIKKIYYPFFYLFTWVGMNPGPFEKREHFSFGFYNLLLKFILNTLTGIGLVCLAHLDIHWYLQSWLFCAGIVFILHFGFFNLFAWILNLIGFRVESLMENPLKAKSLKEFWGGRWNRAFNDLVVPIIYKPFKDKYNKNIAIIAVFLFSGIVHEAVISGSVMSGFGGPTLYFLLQGIGLSLEQKYRLNRIWMYFIIILPAFLLFHPAFMKDAIYPWIELGLLKELI